jgi:FkbM family methyltransferase
VTNLLGCTLSFVDAASFLSQYEEIWLRQIYKIRDQAPSLILDCGANIGLATLFFSRTYPETRIVSFEPDPIVFEVLSVNCHEWGATNVELKNVAVWTADENSVSFEVEGADSGMLTSVASKDSVEVTTVRLRSYLRDSVDLLKIDIEGAETKVLHDSADSLHNVKNIFVEYHSFSDRPQELDKILALLKDAGFRVHLEAGLIAKRPFIGLKSYNGMDQFINIFGIRS